MSKPPTALQRCQGTGQRLRLLRTTLKRTQLEMASRLDVNHQRWSRWEYGVNQIPPLEIIKLKEVIPGLTLDWVFEGDARHVAEELKARLGLS